MKYFYLILLITLNGMVARSQSCLDPAFADNGIKNDYNKTGGTPYPMADGKIIILGINPNNTDNTVLRRLHADGSEDLSFGNGDKIEFPNINASKMFPLPDGKYLFQIGRTARRLLRLNADFSIDRSYGEQGYATVRRRVQDGAGNTSWIDWYAGFGASALGADGSVIIAEASPDGFDDSLLLVRFRPDGFIDSTFGRGGHQVIYNGLYGGGMAGVVIRKDGRFVIGGSGFDDSIMPALMLMRFHPDGSLDSSFGNGGKVYTRLGMQAYPFGMALCQLPDEKLLLAGSIDRGFVARFQPDGGLDSSFNGSAGFTLLHDSIIPSHMQLQGNRIVVAGRMGEVGYTYYGAIRLLPDGRLDTSFCDKGIFEYRPEVYRSVGISDFILDKNYMYIYGGVAMPNGSAYDSYGQLLRINAPSKEEQIGECGSLYPNPASGSLYISYTAAAPYRIYDAAVRQVQQGQYSPGSPVDIAALPAALYFIKLQGSSPCSYKFLKL